MEQRENKVQENKLKKELTYEDKVVQKIIGYSLEKVDGLLTLDGGFFSNLTGKFLNNDDVRTGVNVEVGKKEVALDLDIIVEYGKNIPKLVDELVKTVVKSIKETTDLELIEANVKVVDIKTKEEYDADSVTVQDRVSDITEQASEAISNQADKTKKMVNKTSNDVSQQMKNKRVQ